MSTDLSQLTDIRIYSFLTTAGVVKPRKFPCAGITDRMGEIRPTKFSW
jgi:hypothetical protein